MELEGRGDGVKKVGQAVASVSRGKHRLPVASQPSSAPPRPSVGPPLSRCFLETSIKEEIKRFCRRLVHSWWNDDSICLESVTYSCKEPMEEVRSHLPGLTGLKNLGNTCYMNAILQGLCSLPPLVDYFLSGKYKAALHKGNGEAATAFGCLVSDMWLGESACVSPEGFHSVLGKRYPAFSKRTQQDAQEFLICVLNELHEALKKPSKRKCVPDAKGSQGGVSETPTIITELFEGQLSYDITCLECKSTSHRPESFTVLSLPIPSKSACSLQDCLECFFQQDTLTWNNQIHCSWCGSKQDAAVKATITKAPQIMIFHLKRFEWQGKQKRKLSTDIWYPLGDLDLSPYSSEEMQRRRDAEYSLCAVVNHSGFLDDGHYTAFCKHSVSTNWYSFDDAQISKLSDSSVQTHTAYLLFYTCQSLL